MLGRTIIGRITTTMLVVVITLRVGPARGAGGICAGKSAATRARLIISPAPGLTMDQMPVDHQSGPSSSGVITSARSSATRMVSGSCRAATTAMPFGHVRDRWRVPLRLGRPEPHKAPPSGPDGPKPDGFLFVRLFTATEEIPNLNRGWRIVKPPFIGPSPLQDRTNLHRGLLTTASQHRER